MSVPSSQQYEDDIDLLRYGRFLSSYWRLLIASAVAGALAALALAPVLVPKRFQATTTLAVTQNAATALALTPASSRTLLTNLTLVSQTVNELGLNGDGITTQSFAERALEIQTVPNTNLVKLAVALRDPTKARLAAALLANKTVDLSRRLDQQDAMATRDSIAKQLAEAEVRLNQAQDRLLNYETSAQTDLLESETASQLDRRGDADDIRHDITQSRGTISSLERPRRRTVGAAGAATKKKRAELYRLRLELTRLQAEYDIRIRVYAELSSRYEEARGRSLSGVPLLQIVDSPVQPDQAMPRHRAQFGIVGALIGTLCGVVAALLINRRRVVQLVNA